MQQLRVQMEMQPRLSHLQRCVDPRRADCEPQPPHQRRSHVEKCCWGRACWSSRCWRAPVDVRDGMQREKWGQRQMWYMTKKKETAQYTMCLRGKRQQQSRHHLQQQMCGIENQVNIILVIRCERLGGGKHKQMKVHTCPLWRIYRYEQDR